MNICELLENSSTTNTQSDLSEASSAYEAKEQQQELEEIESSKTHDQHSNQSNLSSFSSSSSSTAPDGNEASSSSDSESQATGNLSANEMNIYSNTTIKISDETTDDTNNDEEIDYNKMLLYFSINDQSNNSGDYNQSDSNNNGNSNSSLLMNENSMVSNSSDEDAMFDSLGPLEKLCKLCNNPTPSNIELASKYVVPAFEFCTTLEDYQRVFYNLKKYCYYSDILLRSLWIEQIQNVIQYIHQESENLIDELESEFNICSELAMLISDLTREQSYQVKKCSITSLLYLIEKQLLNNDQIEKIIMPCLLELVKENNEDFHIDCISLFGKLAPLIGKELTSKYFLEPFSNLCNSPVFHTRKACASNIVDLANVISQEEAETYLLPHFCDFMNDQVWAIRKVCADSFSTFALKCSRRTREEILTESFVRLLNDNSRWVKISAYKSLGPFIATFIKSSSDETFLHDEKIQIDEPESKEPAAEPVNNTNLASSIAKENPNQKDQKQEVQANTEKSTNEEEEEEENSYSNFMFWRNSLPTVSEDNLNIEMSDENVFDNRKESSKSDEKLAKSKKNDSEFTVEVGPNSMYASTNALNICTSENQSSLQQQQQKQINSTFLNELSLDLKQSIVPPILLSYFITMIEINNQNSLDSEMNYNCAFNFPAVALTLGVKNWHYLKDLYKKLSEDLNWKVRQTLAYSIHELAIILGTDYTQVDLVPIFDSYIKDVDEVRIGIVSNLTKFFRILNIDYRRTYISKLNDFLKMDNQRNWRFRNELALQIAEFCELFPTDSLAEYVQPITFILALDKVAQVRTTAVIALVEIFRQFELNNKLIYRQNLIDDIMRTFANNSKWSFRILYLVLCENIIKAQAFSDLEAFCRDFMPKLLSFRNDKVANLRILLAKIVSTQLLQMENFATNQTIAYSTELEITINQLSNDQDSDVRSYFDNSTGDKHSHDQSLLNKTNNESVSMDITSSELNNSASTPTTPTAPTKTTSVSSSSTSTAANIVYYNDDELIDDDDEDEIIDKSKTNHQLKIVNLENDMEHEVDDDDEMDEIIENNLVTEEISKN